MRRRWFIGAVVVVLGVLLLLQFAGVFGANTAGDHPARSGSHEDSRGQQASSSQFLQGAAGAGARGESSATPPSAQGDEEAADAPGTFSLSGIVTDPEGKPLEGVRVQAEYPGNRYRDMRPQVTTDRRGHFRIRSLVPGPYDLAFTREHFLDHQLKGHALERDASPLVVALQPAPTIEGRVVDTAGNPLPGAKLTLFTLPRDTRAPSSSADSGVGEQDLDTPDPADLLPVRKAQAMAGTDGRFILDTPEPALWRLTAELAGYGTVTRELTSPARDVWLVLGAGAGVEVTVVDEHDQPVRGAEVMLWKEAAEEPWEAKAYADEAGHARLQGLDPGPYILAAMPPQSEGFRIAAQKLTARGEEVQHFRLRFTPGLSISGVVVDRAGRPVPDVRILAKLARTAELLDQGSLLPVSLAHVGYDRYSAPHTTRTGPDGRFFIPHVAPLPYSLKFEKEGYIAVEPDPDEETGERRYKQKTVKGGDRDVRVVLTYRGRVSGRVVRADGEPVRSFELNGQPHESVDGTFTEETRGAGEHTLRVLARGIGGAFRQYEAREGEDIELGDLVLGEGRPVRIRVADAVSSRLLPRSWVQLEEVSHQEVLEWEAVGYDGSPMTGLDGTCLLPDVPSRPLLLSVRHEGYEEARHVLAPEEQEVQIRLRPLVLVQGVVRVHGEPIASGRIVVLTPDGEPEQRLEVKDGRYSIPLSPGRHIFRTTCPACPQPAPLFLPRTVEVPEPPGALTVDIDEVTASATVEVLGFEKLSGIMLVPGRQPPATSGAQRAALGALSHPRSTREDQLVRFRNVPSGLYTVLGHYDREDETTEFLQEELVVPAEGVVRVQLRPR